MTRHSALDSAGPVAAAIEHTWWVMFWGGTVVFVLVMLLLWYAMQRDPDARVRVNARWFVFGGGLAFPAIVLTALLVYGTAISERVKLAGAEPLRVEVTARQWWWEVHYPATADTRAFTVADELRIPVGVPVELVLESADVIHSLWIPALAGKVDLVPGRTNHHLIEASEPGRYGGHCAEFCGLLHAEMKLLVIAEPTDAFDAWRDSHTQAASP